MECLLSGMFFLTSNFFLIPFVINFFAAIVYFLMSLLFPVFFSYLNQRSLPFVPPTLDFVPLQEERGGKRGAGSSVWCGETR